ncbi:MAG: prohibitin family protein [Candidatus Nomurabacteria bacterium]|jgi:regulator of protease activity HflC (stomatin/prohibitin superfamily)|nr:prohibitin family protein [Candidatus Nomurabacteria bacterium]
MARTWNDYTEEDGKKAKKAHMPSWAKIAIPATIVVVVLFLCVTCFRVVNTSEVAVITEFGEVRGSVGEGFHVKSPWQDYNIIQVSQVQVSESYTVATNDLQSVTMTVTAQIMVNPENVTELYRKFLGGHVDGIVKPNMASDFKSSVSAYALEDLIKDRSGVQSTMLAGLGRSMESYGINVISIQVSDLTYSDEYKAAVERKVIAAQDKETANMQFQIAEVQAKTNRELAASLDDELLAKMIIERWNGVLPLYVGGESSGLDLLLPQISTPATSATE